jgi:hypothetical protein
MISMEKQIFLKKAVLFCLVLAGISLLLFTTVLKAYYQFFFPLQFALISLITIFSHIRLMNALRLNVLRFNTTYLAIMSAKLFLYVLFILICLLIDRSRAIVFVLSFLILYVFFTIFEVIEISIFLRKNSNS